MKIPFELNPVVVRTDYSNDSAWQRAVRLLHRPALFGPLQVQLYFWLHHRLHPPVYDFIDDPDCDGLGVDELVKIARRSISPDRWYACFYIVDSETIRHAEHPVLVVDLGPQPGRTFRSAPREIWNIEANLSIANADWEDFEQAVDPDGIYRGGDR